MPRKILAIIPARGGSKGIPRKNLRPLAGRPLLVHTVEQALHARAVDRVVVSTDDEKIAELARRHGAQTVDRPAEPAGDTPSSESALLHVLDDLRESERYEPDLVVFLQATSPLRRRQDIDGAIGQLDEAGADAVFSACPVHGFVWRQRRAGPESLTYDHQTRPRRQDLDGEDFLENGAIYVFKPWVLRQLGNRLGGRIAIYPMDPLHSFQVDEPGDLELMERLLLVPQGHAATTSPHHKAPLAAVRLLILDFDGVLTDDAVIVRQDGSEAVRCHRGDGLGIAMLRSRSSIEAVVLSKETNPVVAARCRKLDLPCFQGCDEKLPEIKRMSAERGLTASQVAYVGNDVNDLDAMGWCGLAVAVADARPEVRAAADIVTRCRGGNGAVREVCDLLLAGGHRA